MSEILPNLHWINGLASNIYLWVGETGVFLFDAGLPWDTGRILDYLDKIGRSPTDLVAIFITHADIDHAGSAAALQEKSGAAVLASKQTADLLVQGKSPSHGTGLMRSIMERLLKYRAIPAAAIQQISEGNSIAVLEAWEVIATPGHTMDHHSFYSRRHGVLLAGDALDTRRDRLNCSSEGISADFETARKSARRLLRLNPAAIACGHGKPMLDHLAGDLIQLDRALA